ncbi:MAG: histidine kinase [Planctomycetaceae bacterium]|nr:histidine kinase [Planctomycetaceae bacterium]
MRKVMRPNGTPISASNLRQIDRLEVNASWLLRLRWVAVVGQLITVATAVFVVGVQLAVTPLLSVIAFTAITNIAFALWLKTHTRLSEDLRARQDHWVLAGLMSLDLLSLTMLLYFSGGPTNPFIIFFFVNLALAAVVLSNRSVWWLLLLAIACLLVLFVAHTPVPELSKPADIFPPRRLALQQVGLLTAVALCAGVAVYFITRVTRELQQRDDQLRLAEQQRSRSERLEALATLAAGAGHELASPLSTIAVIANDLNKHLEGTSVPNSVIEDVGLIRSELDRCRHILDGMASSSGLATGEEMLPVSLRDLLDETLAGLSRRDRVELSMSKSSAERLTVVPLLGAANSIRGLIRNGLDATADDANVTIQTVCDDQTVTISVIDTGSGMSDEVLARVGEPFFTTKEPGQGMGLGLYLTQNLFQRLGGELILKSAVGRGTVATVKLPAASRT